MARIAILSDAYLPDGTFIHAKMLHDLALELVSQGHTVVVLTPGKMCQDSKLEITLLENVEIWRFKTYPTRVKRHLIRLINETLLSFNAIRAINKKDWAFELVINYSPTIFFGPLAFFLKLKGAYVYLVLRDFFPQWIIDQGLIRNSSFAAKYLRLFERINYSASNVIGLQSPKNIEVFKRAHKNHSSKASLLYNWITPKPNNNSEWAHGFLVQHHIDKKFIFFYGGNIGHAQDIPYLIQLASLFQDYQNVHFLIVGQGDKFQDIRSMIELQELSNVTLAPSISQEQYQGLLLHVDIGVFTLSKHHSAHNFPGKIVGYMAAGLPILGAVNKGNDLLNLINNEVAGLISNNGEIETFYAHAKSFIEDSALRDKMSINSKKLLDQYFSVKTASQIILRAFEDGLRKTR